MKKLIFIPVLYLFAVPLFGQQVMDTTAVRPKNSIALNVLGDVSLLSINYERLIFLDPHVFLAGTIGVGFNNNDSGGTCVANCKGSRDIKNYTTIPYRLTGNFGGKRGFLELGLGQTRIKGSLHHWVETYVIIGLRIQPIVSDRINFRIFLQPILTKSPYENIIKSPIGMSFGAVF